MNLKKKKKGGAQIGYLWSIINKDIDDQNFSKFFLFSPLIFETSSDCVYAHVPIKCVLHQKWGVPENTNFK